MDKKRTSNPSIWTWMIIAVMGLIVVSCMSVDSEPVEEFAEVTVSEVFVGEETQLPSALPEETEAITEAVVTEVATQVPVSSNNDVMAQVQATIDARPTQPPYVPPVDYDPELVPYNQTNAYSLNDVVPIIEEQFYRVYNDQGALFSPDGEHIIFLSNRYCGQGYTNNLSSLFLADADGSNPIQLVELCQDDFEIDYAWSPDGSRIVFTQDNPDELGNILTMLTFMPNADGSQFGETNEVTVSYELLRVEPRMTFESPSFYPSGDALMYQKGIGSFELFSLDLNSGEELLLRPYTDWYNPQLSPDGQWVLFTATVRDDYDGDGHDEKS